MKFSSLKLFNEVKNLTEIYETENHTLLHDLKVKLDSEYSNLTEMDIVLNRSNPESETIGMVVGVEMYARMQVFPSGTFLKVLRLVTLDNGVDQFQLVLDEDSLENPLKYGDVLYMNVVKERAIDFSFFDIRTTQELMEQDASEITSYELETVITVPKMERILNIVYEEEEELKGKTIYLANNVRLLKNIANDIELEEEETVDETENNGTIEIELDEIEHDSNVDTTDLLMFE